MNAACPATWASLTFEQFFAGPFNAPLPSFCLFRILDPANELVPAKRREALPKLKSFGVGP
jgi:hypothetical protein